MRLIKADKEKFCFHFPEREKRLLVRVLLAYPLVPVSHQRLSRNDRRPEAEKMLDEALASQRRENKERVGFFLLSNLRQDEEGYSITLQATQMEWMLQVLNDVRVGSWLLLGSPASELDTFKALNESTAPHYVTMEVAGEIQRKLLNALEGESAADSGPQADA